VFTLEELGPANWSLAGSGESDDILAMRSQIELKISNAKVEKCILSLASLQEFNSQFLSLCLCLLRHAQECNLELVFTNTPTKLFDMARVGGLEFIFSDAS
jgi:ABC-type transporter Mla MlaB component